MDDRKIAIRGKSGHHKTVKSKNDENLVFPRGAA